MKSLKDFYKEWAYANYEWALYNIMYNSPMFIQIYIPFLITPFIK